MILNKAIERSVEKAQHMCPSSEGGLGEGGALVGTTTSSGPSPPRGSGAHIQPHISCALTENMKGFVHELGDDIAVEEKKSFNAIVISISSEVNVDSVEKEVNREPLGKLASKNNVNLITFETLKIM